jgi:hypothetical protein
VPFSRVNNKQAEHMVLKLIMSLIGLCGLGLVHGPIGTISMIHHICFTVTIFLDQNPTTHQQLKPTRSLELVLSILLELLAALQRLLFKGVYHIKMINS